MTFVVFRACYKGKLSCGVFHGPGRKTLRIRYGAKRGKEALDDMHATDGINGLRELWLFEPILKKSVYGTAWKSKPNVDEPLQLAVRIDCSVNGFD